MSGFHEGQQVVVTRGMAATVVSVDGDVVTVKIGSDTLKFPAEDVQTIEEFEKWRMEEKERYWSSQK